MSYGTNLWESEGDAGILPGGTGVELPHVEQLEQVAPHLVHGRPDGLVQAQHLHHPEGVFTGISRNQDCGSGSVSGSDPDSIGSVDPDPGRQK
jgi:hypothetical protein